MDDVLLSVDQVTKMFTGVVALENASLNLRRGEIVALVGANGAGKSTLIKIISGVYPPDSGTVRFHGEPMETFTPAEALRRGVSTIYQDFNLVPSLSVAKNIMLGREPRRRWGLLDSPEMNRVAAGCLESLGIRIDPEEAVFQLTVSQRQMVEIARALLAESHILVMDEPTSALTGYEVETLMDIMRRLKRRGAGILFISHRLEEVLQISDRVVVLRDGKKVAETDTSDSTTEQIVVQMIGQDIHTHRRCHSADRGDVVLRVEGIGIRGQFEDISFDLDQGEVLGLTGLVGSGRTEIAHALAGVTILHRGTVSLQGERLPTGDCRAAVRAGIALVPEDRKRLALIPLLSLQDNICAPNQGLLAWCGVRNMKREGQLAAGQIDRLDIKCTGRAQPVRTLSGGNQQKVTIAKWLAAKPKVLILDEPTHAIDVKTKAEVAKIIESLAAQGVAILLISSEIEELLDLCDRILVLCEGRLVDAIRADRASKEGIARSMMGVAEA